MHPAVRSSRRRKIKRRNRLRRRFSASLAHLRRQPTPINPVHTCRFLITIPPIGSPYGAPFPSPYTIPGPPSNAAPLPSITIVIPPSPPPPSQSPSNHAPLIGGITGGVVALLFICGSIFFCWWRRLRRPTGSDEDKERATSLSRGTEAPPQSSPDYVPDSVRGPRRFTFSELAVATGNFSESRILGRGGFGAVYKGFLDGTDCIAVKRIAEDSRQGMKEFVAEVTIISEIRHRNLVKLRGWCQEPDGKLFVVYDYLANGSIDGMLFDDGRCGALTWERRMGIARGVGAALQYLHEGCERVIVHRDVKTSNVLLDEGFVAKLGDFGLSRRVREGAVGHTTNPAGTLGYMAPEIVTTGKVTTESDVYSFGAVLAELATGRKAFLQPSHTLLVDWVWDLYGRNRLLEAADPRLNGRFDVVGMERLLIVALACSHPDPASRPTASYAVNHLLGSLPLPTVLLRKPAIISLM